MPASNRGPGRRSIAALAFSVSRSLTVALVFSLTLSTALPLVRALPPALVPSLASSAAPFVPGLARAQDLAGVDAVGGSDRDARGTVAAAPAKEGATGANTHGPAWHALRQQELLESSARLLGRFEPRSEGLLMPLAGELSSRFGWRNVSVAGNRYHGGIDLAVDEGTEVAASADGVVSEAGWAGAYGYSVLVDHGDGIETRYAHLSAIWVGAGESVRQGDTLGLSGSTGASTGPHLHFEVRVAGVAVDPLEHVR